MMARVFVRTSFAAASRRAGGWRCEDQCVAPDRCGAGRDTGRCRGTAKKVKAEWAHSSPGRPRLEGHQARMQLSKGVAAGRDADAVLRAADLGGFGFLERRELRAHGMYWVDLSTRPNAAVRSPGEDAALLERSRAAELSRAGSGVGFSRGFEPRKRGSGLESAPETTTEVREETRNATDEGFERSRPANGQRMG